MIIEQSFRVEAPRREVAALLTDVDRVSRCVPGVRDVRPVSDEEYQATLQARLGPISAAFEGSLHLDDSGAPERLRATGEGRDARSGSRAQVEFLARLEDAGEATVVHARADVVLRGRLGQFGTGVINSTARQLVRSFAECLNTSLDAGVPAAAPKEPSGLGRVAVRGFLTWLLGLPRAIIAGWRTRARPAEDDEASQALEYREPSTVEEACRLLAELPHGSKALAGGTAVTLMMREGLIAPQRLVSLAKLDDLGGISEQGDFVRLGAGVTLTEVASSPIVRRRLPSLAYACSRVGNVRVRNVATIGGNLAESDYASDPPSVLASLGAFCTVRGPHETRTVFVDSFVTGFYANVLEPGELVTEVVVPAPAGRRAVYLKYVSRSSEDRPCVGVAARADFNGDAVRELDVVVGAVSDTPQRLLDVSDLLGDGGLDRDAAARVASAYAERLEPMDDARGSSWYRRQMIEVFVRRAVSALADNGTEAMSRG